MSTVLLVGSGGREHAMAWKLAQSPRVSRLIVAPGNDGFSTNWGGTSEPRLERWQVPVTGTREIEALATRARSEGVDLAVIGPDNPLAEGIVDALEAAGVRAFGPTKAAAQIEASKAFAKDVMRAAGVPTAEYIVAKSVKEAHAFLRQADWSSTKLGEDAPVSGWVIKADGLALGKGVVVCETLEQALPAAEALMDVSGSLVIEERLSGEELSWLALCDGERAALFEPARDYKRLRDGNEGPNTGGMGAYSPVPGIPAGLARKVREQVFLPTLREMKKRGAPFRGVLYAGLMYDQAAGKLWVLEFNARFGDPETQVLLPRMKDDLFEWCDAVARGDLGRLPDSIPMIEDRAVYVVAAAPGYPDRPEKGEVIGGEIRPASLRGHVPHYFCAGVAQRKEDSLLVTAGGRVYGALGMAENFERARAIAYDHLTRAGFSRMQFRRDIGELSQ